MKFKRGVWSIISVQKRGERWAFISWWERMGIYQYMSIGSHPNFFWQHSNSSTFIRKFSYIPGQFSGELGIMEYFLHYKSTLENGMHLFYIGSSHQQRSSPQCRSSRHEHTLISTFCIFVVVEPSRSNRSRFPFLLPYRILLGTVSVC